MMRVWAIALNTFREATRNRVFYMILIFIILMLLSSAALGMLSLGEQDRVVKHLGLSAMNIFGLMLAMFVGVALVHEELENKTIYTLMSSGVSRGQFLFGKFLGLTMTIVVNITMMTLLLTLLILFTPDSHLTISVYQAAWMSLFEMMIIIAIAILFSVVTSPVLAMILTFLMWVIGMMSQSLQLFALRLGELGNHVAKYVILGILLFLPRLDAFNLKDAIVYEEVLDFRYLYMIYGLLYTAAVLVVSNFIFRRKDFQ